MQSDAKICFKISLLHAIKYMAGDIFPLNCVDGMINMPKVRSRHLQCVGERPFHIKL